MKWLKRKLMANPMIAFLAGLKGNARACLWPEPLWGVPYNLYLPYASLFMAALGLSPSEIGYVASINIVSQVIFATLSGVITDKLGRRWTTFTAPHGTPAGETSSTLVGWRLPRRCSHGKRQ